MKRNSLNSWKKRRGDDSTGSTGSWPVPARGNGDEEGGKGSFWQAMATLTSLGWILALPVAGGVLLGAWLDRQLGTTPTLTLGLLGAGIVIAALEAYLVVAEAQEEGKRS